MLKTGKKILCTLLVVVMCLTAAPLDGFVGIEWPELPEINFGEWFGGKAEAANYNGSCGGNLIWSLDTSTGVLTISGSGAMSNYNNSYSKTPWYSYGSSIRTIVLPYGLTSIGDYAFYDCTSLENILIPNSVKKIYSSAFENCSSLESITIPNSITGINSRTFYNCKSLKSITIPDSIKAIGNHVFAHCENLTSITIPDGVTAIGEYMFYNCINLKSITIPNSVTSIDEYAFYNCKSLESMTIPNSVTSIGNYTFCNCAGLESIIISDSVTSISDYMFTNCVSLENIIIPNSVTFIGDYAFNGCKNLINITIGNSVKKIYEAAFRGCTSLENITIPEGVTSIGNYAFENCKSLTNVIIPNSITTIGGWAFRNCTNITSVYYGGTETQWKEIIIYAYNNDFTDATRYYNYVHNSGSGDPSTPSENFKFRRDEYEKKMDYSGDIPMMEITETIYLDCNTDLLVSKGYEYSDIKFVVSDTSIISLENSSLSSVTDDKIVMSCYVVPLKSGTTTLTATLPDGTSASCKIISEVIGKEDEDSEDNDTIIKSEWFEKGAYSGYDHELAQFCANIVNKGYSYNIDTVTSDLRVYGLSIRNIYSSTQGINMSSERDEVNYFIADKTLEINGVDKTLIVVGCIGSYKKQWYSNFDPMSIDSVKDYADLSEKAYTHHGFANARDYVFRNLVAYIDFNNIDKSNSIILLTGHSRGAATVNLLGAKLIDISSEFGISINDIYTYGFATPNTTTNNIFPSKYNSIKNIVNPEDFVTKVLPSSWGYKRYGVTYKLPSATNDKDYDDYLSRLKRVNANYEPYEDGEKTVFTLLENMSERLSNIEDYYLKRDAYDGETTYDYFKKCICPFVAEEVDWKFYTNIADTLVKFGTFQKQLTSFFLNHQQKRPDFENSHSMNTYYTFLKTMTSDEVTKFRFSYSGTVNCPVDVEIYDKETGELVGRIVDNVVDEEIKAKDNSIVMDVDGDSKNFWLPSNGDYEIKLIGNDKGTMDYTMSEIDSDTGEVKRVNFFDVAITDGLTMTADVESEEFIIEEHKLTYQNGKTLKPTEVLDEEEIPEYAIEVTATEGGTATESHTAKSGDYVSLETVAEDGYKFVGWYENGKLISNEETYAFVAKSDRNLEARFNKKSDDTDYQVGDIIQFGSYPQSKVTDSATISALNAKAPAWSNWTSYGYYTGKDDADIDTGNWIITQGDWMRYTDVTYNGDKYRGVKFTQYRPWATLLTSSVSNTYQDDNGYSTNIVYWFKFEPIDWHILDPSTGFVVCEYVIDSQAYSNMIYHNSKIDDVTYANFNDSLYSNFACDYETSSIRKWLNVDFYNLAFSETEKKGINTTVLNNDGYNTLNGHTGYEKLDSNETEDKIFLLAYSEVIANDYGFDQNDDAGRKVIGSDYAKSQGLDANYGCCWGLRTPGTFSAMSTAIEGSGTINQLATFVTSLGIRPALRLKDISNIGKEEHKHNYTKTVVSPTCEQYGYTQYLCECGEGYSTEFVSAKGHSYVATKVTDATCTQDKVVDLKCSSCGSTKKTYYAGTAKGHVFGEYKSDNNATCAANGTKTATCKNCKATDTKEELGTQKEHDFYFEIRREATCTEEGTRIEKCHNCDWMSYEYYIDDHSFGNKDSKCKDCGYDRTKGCSCKCHKGGITGFFFKIGLFFQKIFKKNKVCKCGKYHY